MAMRAVSEDGDAAALMGIDCNKVMIFTFVLGGAWPASPACSTAFVYKQVYFFRASSPASRRSRRAVLGGIGNIPGAMIGGFFLGIVESVGPALFLDGLGIPAPYQLRDLIAFTLLVMVLIFRPQGLLGERWPGSGPAMRRAAIRVGHGIWARAAALGCISLAWSACSACFTSERSSSAR